MNNMWTYICKPVKVNAFKVDYELMNEASWEDYPSWMRDYTAHIILFDDISRNKRVIMVKNSTGSFEVNDGDYLVVNSKGELVGYSPEEFERLFESADSYSKRQKELDVVKTIGNVHKYLWRKYPEMRELSIIFTKLDEALLWYKEMREHNPIYEGAKDADKGE